MIWDIILPASMLFYLYIFQNHCRNVILSMFVTGTLRSAHLLEVAQRITNEEELVDLGLKALKLPDYKLDAASTNAPDIQQAAYKILQTWAKRFESGKEAHKILLKSLKHCGMNKLATLLK